MRSIPPILLLLLAPALWVDNPPPTKIIVVVVVQDGKVAVATDPPTTPQGPTPPPPDKPPTTEDASTPLRVAGRRYTRGTRDVLAAAADWVKAHPTSSKADLMDKLRTGRAPVVLAFETALDAAINPHVAQDAVGTFSNPAAIARALDEAGKGVGSP